MPQQSEADDAVGKPTKTANITEWHMKFSPLCLTLQRCVITMAEPFSIERRKLMRFMGAKAFGIGLWAIIKIQLVRR